MEVKDIDISQIESLYKDNIDIIDEEINTTEELYEELKTHFDNIKKSTSPGALTFISKQTPNLITLRKNKIDLIKEKNTVLKNIIDSTVRLSIDTENDSKDDAILKELHKMLLNNTPDTYKTEEVMKLDEEEESKEDMDTLLEERFNDIQKNKKTKKKKSKEMKSKKSKKYNIVIDMEGNMYAVDKDYNILDDDDIEYPDWEIEFYEDEETGAIYAVNQFNEEIEIIEFEEDD